MSASTPPLQYKIDGYIKTIDIPCPEPAEHSYITYTPEAPDPMPEGYTHTPQGPWENEKRKSASPGQPAETRCDKLMSQFSGWWVAPGRHTLPRHTGPHRTIKQQSGARGGPMGRGKTQFNLSLHILRYPIINSG